MANNDILRKAQADKSDEFYTLESDIENEISAYLERNPGIFRGKTVMCPCDTRDSSFAIHFTKNFTVYGLKKLICTACNPEDGGKGSMYVVETDIDGMTARAAELEGNGDFRSGEVTGIAAGADFIITNPPFSLFREFVSWAKGKKFSLIGNNNAISYSEIFQMIKDDRIWLGASRCSDGMCFRVPEGYEYSPKYKHEREIDGHKVMRVPSACWFTNIEHGRRHGELKLSTMDELAGMGVEFSKYDNYDAIDVGKTAWIPKDYRGVMGVPITWVNRYSPEQFEIVGIDEAHGVGKSCGVWTGGSKKPSVGGKTTYARVFIRNRI